MFDFDKQLSALAEQTVLCIGDLMLDEFVYGDVARISPEAPTPVIAVKRTEVMIGGAGNVARNLASLGTQCVFVGVVGNDDAGRILSEELDGYPLIEFPSRRRCRAYDHAQGTFRVRASLNAHAARRLGNGGAGRSRQRGRADRTRHRGDAERGRRRAVRLRQGRADPARGPRDHQGRQRTRQAGGGRSKRPRLFDLSRRHADYAEPGRNSPTSCTARRRPTSRSRRRRCNSAASSTCRRCW